MTVPTFYAQQYYVKQLTVQRLQMPNVQQAPDINLHVAVSHQWLNDTQAEVVLTLQVQALQDKVPSLVIAVEQAGLFQCEEKAQHANVLNVYAPNLLYPYACQVVAQSAIQAGFPALILSPLNLAQVAQLRNQEE